MKDKECMLSTTEFIMLCLTPFVAALLFVAWPLTIFVFGVAMIVGSVATLLRRYSSQQ